MRPSTLRYSNQFVNVSATNEGVVDQSRPLASKLVVAMATSLERSQNHSSTIPENLAKIDPEDTQIIGLKGDCEKRKRTSRSRIGLYSPHGSQPH